MNFPFQWSDMLVSWRVLNVSIFLRGSSNAVYVKFLRDFQEKHRALFGLAINIRASVCVWSGIEQLGILLGGYVGDEHNYFGVILGMNTTTYHNYFRVILGEVVCLRFPLLFLKMYHGSTKWRHLCKGYIYIYLHMSSILAGKIFTICGSPEEKGMLTYSQLKRFQVYNSNPLPIGSMYGIFT